ncbi:MAG TPA: hypothetical protein VKR55_02900 [Bradyrhizobium sp.]|uniref:hypothetical protein n=1 Tax=Bradyrhizobium sp. TaxID=376 RepID=UPI002C60CB33|nr:hypothetical protein [Bradyrhizobium sp.]HLZ01080.1 hypothetical protein [Bradyrhizobium sp.]
MMGIEDDHQAEAEAAMAMAAAATCELERLNWVRVALAWRDLARDQNRSLNAALARRCATL